MTATLALVAVLFALLTWPEFPADHRSDSPPLIVLPLVLVGVLVAGLPVALLPRQRTVETGLWVPVFS